jgi:hypothetical protein
MFYRATLVSGVSERRAKLVYAGVYFAGPRWENIARLSQPAVPTQTGEYCTPSASIPVPAGNQIRTYS